MKIVSQNKHRCNYILPRWSFNSKPTLLCLQLYSEVTENFVCCLLLSKLKLGLELKRKYSPKSQILNNSYPTFLERWNLRECCSSVASVQGSCFNSQFLDWETICSTVGSVEARGMVIIVLVLTHNFLIRKSVKARLEVYKQEGG